MHDLAPGTLEAFGLYLVRTSALVMGAPILGSGTGFAGHKVALIFAVAFLLYSVSGAPLDHSAAPIEFACLALREVLIGLALSFSLHVVMLALNVAGEMVGNEMGFNMASLIDPITGVRTPVVTSMFEAFFVLGFFLVDGHHMLLRGLEQSFERAPVGSVELSKGLPWLVEKLFTQMFTAGLTFAAPVLVLLAAASLLLALLARAVPQLNINEVGFTARIAVGLIALFAFAPLLSPALQSLYSHLESALGATLDLLGT